MQEKARFRRRNYCSHYGSQYERRKKIMPARIKAGSIRSRQRVSERALFSAFSRTCGIFQSSPGARHSFGSLRKLEQPKNRSGSSQAAHQHSHPAPKRSTAAKPPARIRLLPRPHLTPQVLCAIIKHIFSNTCINESRC